MVSCWCNITARHMTSVKIWIQTTLLVCIPLFPSHINHNPSLSTSINQYLHLFHPIVLVDDPTYPVMSSYSHPPSTTGSDSDSNTSSISGLEADGNTNDTAANTNAAATNYHIVEHEQGSPTAVIHPITQVNTPPYVNASSSLNAAIQDIQYSS